MDTKPRCANGLTEGCTIVTQQRDTYELEVVSCDKCKFHLGIDASYLERGEDVTIACPNCNSMLIVLGADGD